MIRMERALSVAQPSTKGQFCFSWEADWVCQVRQGFLWQKSAVAFVCTYKQTNKPDPHINLPKKPMPDSVERRAQSLANWCVCV